MSEAVESAIVGDIGGTHARFACVNLSTMTFSNSVIYHTAQFSSLADAFKTYQKENNFLQVQQAAIAVACPVSNSAVQMTNLDWRFSVPQLKKELNLNHLSLLNDFTAIALSLKLLPETEKIQIGIGDAHPGKPIVVLGPGTGLGVSLLMPHLNGYLPFSSEAGHMDWRVENEEEWFIHQLLAKRFGHVSAERVLSGPGLEAIYMALAAYRHLEMQPLKAETIAHLALQNESQLALDTVLQFFKSLGAFAGDLALAINAFGGVYLAGGIVPKLMPLLNQGSFREQFEAKGRFSKANKNIATFVITAKQPGLLGAAMALNQ